MKPIASGQRGAAVEDVQQRLAALGFAIDEAEAREALFGATTLAAVRAFRSQQGLASGDFVDDEAWNCLVNATYQFGDRTLYLRLPYFKGADVSQLQMTLNVLGFSCGEVDGEYGPLTEAAVREFQTNVGISDDGIAFQDTFDAIERLHHVWRDKTVSPEFSVPHSGIARAADVLEDKSIVVEGTDAIARNVAPRCVNAACATTGEANIRLVDNATCEAYPDADLIITVATAPLGTAELPEGCVGIVVESDDELAGALAAALAQKAEKPAHLRIELSYLNHYDGTVTNRVAQRAAIVLLDALCAALGA